MWTWGIYLHRSRSYQDRTFEQKAFQRRVLDNRKSKLEKFTKISSIARLKKEFRFESVGKIGIINLISQIELNWLANKSSLSDILRV